MATIVVKEIVDDVFLERQTYSPAGDALEDRDRFPGSARWSSATRVAFRFAFVYFLLFNLPFPLDLVPLISKVAEKYEALWNRFVPWVGTHTLGLKITVLPNGSGDTTFNYVQVLCFLVLATIVTVLWSALDRKRLNYLKLNQWLRLYVRVVLGVILLNYGAAKVIQSQMPPPPLSRLVETYGDSSPMGLLWTFMGASRAYNAFTGGSEMLAGALLIIPGLTTLGALLSVAVMSNVFMLNMCYDVPVKIFSFHLLLMSAFLALPDLRRLANLFLLHRREKLHQDPLLFKRRWLNRGLVAAQLVFGVIMAVFALYQSQQGAKLLTKQVGPPLYGMWSVEEYIVDGKVQPVSEETRWQRVIFDNTLRITVQPMIGPRQRLFLHLDTPKHAFTLTKMEDPDWKASFNFQNAGPGWLTLNGQMDGHAVSMRLLHVDAEKSFLLTSRGFHWINEYPFNR